ncbi:polysaccharide biosynthesis tyrosine autokinase [Luteolibacter sp. SL250]|uniref:polysaccharide biosynthesis tyrosine autokinase n=1 Tax=Luteolibacter sp. SL250 TaxID=2995170 RepID=UPI00226FC7AA|nr:polysaccharide biosynthesis tyrosine autokinase [Luteolibacter sp. SL250]WAC19627.1 polysaccharide biosynthesis tyrosine autokinase [Luteolibacter sp. SL250]
MSISSEKPKFDPLKLISQALSYVKHVRLMLLMLAAGLMVGMIVYMFTTPSYRSTAVLSMHGFGAPMVDRDVPETYQTTTFQRSFLTRFNSAPIQLAAAKRMGLVGESATSEDLRSIIPSLLLVPTDARTLEMTVVAHNPETVRGFAQAMVEAYREVQHQSYEEYRDEALRRYTEQVDRLEAEISETISSLSSVERDQNLTEAMLEQQSLFDIPKQLIQTRERLARMKDIKVLLTNLESKPEGEDADAASGPVNRFSNMMSLLSLLANFENDTDVTVGDVVSTTGPLRGTVKAVNSEGTNHIVAPADVDSIEPWRKLEKERRILISEIQQNASIYQPGHRVMKDLTQKLTDTERALETEFRVLRQKFDLNFTALEEKEKQLQARLPEYHAISEQVGKSSHVYSTIEAKQKMWDGARARLAQKLATVTFAEEFDWVELRFKGLVSLRDEVPISPNKFKAAIIGLAIGLAGAFGLPTALNLLNTTASTVPQLEQLTGIEGIGIVPLTSKSLLEDVARSPAQGASVPNYLLECFRVIRANIVMHPNRRNRSQIVLVTSARPQEGKTTQATNLAWAFQSMGEKTLLLDCDLRRGRVHGVVGIDKAPGMTRLLLGECSLEDAIHSTGPNGFDVIPRGPVIAGTTELLCQDVFLNMLEHFRKTYDRIVIDAPPVLGLSESSSLQKVVDGTVLVVRAEVTGRKDVMDSINILRRSQAHFFGFVLNAVDLSKLGNYYNYYYYSAPYYDQMESEEQPRPLAGVRS